MLLGVFNAGRPTPNQSYSVFVQLKGRGKMPDGKTYLCKY